MKRGKTDVENAAASRTCRVKSLRHWWSGAEHADGEMFGAPIEMALKIWLGYGWLNETPPSRHPLHPSMCCLEDVQ